MGRNFFAACALLLFTGLANANAWVSGTFAGADVTQDGAGETFTISDPIGVALSPGASLSWTFAYSITLHNDGLQAAREWDECLTVSPGPICGPAADGQEHAEFDFGALTTKSATGLFNFTVVGLPHVEAFIAAPGTTATYSGTFTITETASAEITEPFTPLDALFLYSASFVDSSSVVSAVPELPGAALMLAGLVGVGLTRRRR